MQLSMFSPFTFLSFAALSVAAFLCRPVIGIGSLESVCSPKVGYWQCCRIIEQGGPQVIVDIIGGLLKIGSRMVVASS